MLQCDSVALSESGVILFVSIRGGGDGARNWLFWRCTAGKKWRISDAARGRAPGRLPAQAGGRSEGAGQISPLPVERGGHGRGNGSASRDAGSRRSAGRHVLAIRIPAKSTIRRKRGRKRGLGRVGNGTDVGLFVHPVLAVDAQTQECLGLVDAQIWRRSKGKAENYRRLPIEEKESYRWVKGGQEAKAVLAEAAMVTVIDDREGDIYEKWARLPDERALTFLTRACRDRSLVDGGKLFASLAQLPEAHRFTLELPARPGKRGARTAQMAVRFGRIRVCRPGVCSAPREARAVCDRGS